MEIWNRLIAIVGEEGRGIVKGREGVSQRTCMNDSWTWTTEKGLTMGEKGGLGGVGEKEKKLGHCNRMNNKKNKVEKKKNSSSFHMTNLSKIHIGEVICSKWSLIDQLFSIL